MNARKIVSRGVEGAVKEAGRQVLTESPPTVKVTAHVVYKLKKAVDTVRRTSERTPALTQESLDGRRKR